VQRVLLFFHASGECCGPRDCFFFSKSSLQSGHVECRSTNQYLDILNKVLLHFNEAVDDEEFAMQRANFMLNTILLKEPTTAASA